MFNIKGFAALILFALIGSNSAQAQTVTINQISQSDFEQLSREVSANFTHTSVSGATSLGSIWGFQFGLIAGQTPTPGLNTLVQRAKPDASVDKIYHAGLLGMLTVPFGITGEVLVLPSVGSNDFKAKSTSLAVKWTLTEFLLEEFPVDLAVKAFYTTAQMDTKQRVNNTDQNINFQDKMMGLSFLVSKNLGVIEPYAGLIYNKASVDLSYSGGATIFDTNYTTGQSANVDTSSTGMVLGAEAKLLFFNAGLEFTRIFGANRYTAKLAFSF